VGFPCVKEAIFSDFLPRFRPLGSTDSGLGMGKREALFCDIFRPKFRPLGNTDSGLSIAKRETLFCDFFFGLNFGPLATLTVDFP
jgi:hypothetical protein